MTFASTFVKVQQLIQELSPKMRAWAIGGLLGGLGFAAWAREVIKDVRHAREHDQIVHQVKEESMKLQLEHEKDRNKIQEEIGKVNAKVDRLLEEIPNIRELEKGQIRTEQIIKNFEKHGQDLARFRPINPNVKPAFGPECVFWKGIDCCNDADQAVHFIANFRCMDEFVHPSTTFIPAPSCLADTKDEVDETTPKL